MLCPCFSERPYADCCKSYHDEISHPPTAVDLMRSRYSAYSLSLPDYIIRTTHPENPLYTSDKEFWRKSILSFCLTTDFVGLEIRSFTSSGNDAFVTFRAHLQQNETDVSFTEKSFFLCVFSQWLYRSGEILS